jgi:hypothetical protein
MELHLFVFENRLETILRKLFQTVDLYVETHLLSLLEQMERALLRGQPEGEKGRFPRPRQLDERLAPSDWRAFAAELRDDVAAALKELPEEMEILSEASFHELDEDPFADAEVVTVPLRHLVEEAVELELLDPLRTILNGWPDAMEQGRGAVRSAVRLLEYLYRKGPSADEEEPPPEEGGLEALLERTLEAIGREREKTGGRILEFEVALDRLLEATFGALNPYLLIRASGSLVDRRRLREGKRLLSGVEAGRRTVRAYLRRGLAGLFYRRSGALLLTRKMEAARRLPPTRVDRCLALAESVSPSPAVLASLPPYYRQMFLGRQAVNPNLLVRRPREMALVQAAVQRHRQGSGGGLLLVGPPWSGKTPLTRMVVGRFFANAPAYHLFPPAAGSVDTGVFSTRLKEALQIDGDDQGMFEALPPGAVLVLHDLELWWERTPQGMAVLDRIGGLIDRYGDRIFFLVNAASQSFRLIRRLKRMEDVFMRMVPCEPFDAQEIQAAGVQRHEAAGLGFSVDGREGRALSDWRLARLFGRYFDYAGGAVGTAFQGWIKGIERVEDNHLFLVPPDPPSLEVLEDMDAEIQCCLANCALHKRMDSAKFARVMRLSDGDAERSLGLLARCGLLRRQPGGDVWEIDSYLEPFLVKNGRRWGCYERLGDLRLFLDGGDRGRPGRSLGPGVLAPSRKNVPSSTYAPNVSPGTAACLSGSRGRFLVSVRLWGPAVGFFEQLALYPGICPSVGGNGPGGLLVRPAGLYRRDRPEDGGCLQAWRIPAHGQDRGAHLEDRAFGDAPGRGAGGNGEGSLQPSHGVRLRLGDPDGTRRLSFRVSVPKSRGVGDDARDALLLGLLSSPWVPAGAAPRSDLSEENDDANIFQVTLEGADERRLPHIERHVRDGLGSA